MKQKYEQWLLHSLYKDELLAMQQDEQQIQDSFYKDVEFGTGGMRGRLGAGTNRINSHTIRRVAYGLAQQIAKQGDVAKARGVVIAYDTRHFSQQFAYETAGVLAAQGIQTYVFKESRPTPELSFAVRYLHAIAGIVITASHNPKQYNGFKVYGDDGAQLTPAFADEIVENMNAVTNIFEIPCLTKEQLETSPYFTDILEKLDDAYATALKTLTLTNEIDHNMTLVYTPLHGAGLTPTIRGLSDFGFKNVHLVEEQAKQDGDFPTVIYPNPEEAAAFESAIELGKTVGADLLLATDPDADRLGVAVRDGENYKLLTGNQLGAMLLHYILSQHQTRGTLPENGAMLKTIVTSEFGTAIAKHFGVTTIDTLTGFKFIAEKIAQFEQTNEHIFMFGYEESYGYLAGDFARDKDAVQIALLTAEMAAYYKLQNKSLIDVLKQLYNEFGHYEEALLSFAFEGFEGQQKIARIMEQLRNDAPTTIVGERIVAIEDYSLQQRFENGVTSNLTLPKANVLKYFLESETWICVRPSGTEPKIKFYIGAKGEGTDKYKSAVAHWAE